MNLVHSPHDAPVRYRPFSHRTSVASHAQTAPPAAAELRVFDPSLIDTTIDPCENFYRYSCNAWFKRNPLPADQTSYGRFTELAELNRLQLRQILEQAAAPAAGVTRSSNEQKIGDDYASCMDTATLNRLGIAPLQPELDRITALKTAAQLPALLAPSSASAPTQTSMMPTPSSLSTGQAALACRSAITTHEPTPNPSNSAVSMWPMYARFSLLQASLTQKPQKMPTS